MTIDELLAQRTVKDSSGVDLAVERYFEPPNNRDATLVESAVIRLTGRVGRRSDVHDLVIFELALEVSRFDVGVGDAPFLLAGVGALRLVRGGTDGVGMKPKISFPAAIAVDF